MWKLFRHLINVCAFNQSKNNFSSIFSFSCWRKPLLEILLTKNKISICKFQIKTWVGVEKIFHHIAILLKLLKLGTSFKSVKILRVQMVIILVIFSSYFCKIHAIYYSVTYCTWALIVESERKSLAILRSIINAYKYFYPYVSFFRCYQHLTMPHVFSCKILFSLYFSVKQQQNRFAFSSIRYA